jgi:hypothetical protein
VARKCGKINGSGLYRAAHNGLLAGLSAAGPTNDFKGEGGALEEG